jgi:hypothetical protein
MDVVVLNYGYQVHHWNVKIGEVEASLKVRFSTSPCLLAD